MSHKLLSNSVIVIVIGGGGGESENGKKIREEKRKTYKSILGFSLSTFVTTKMNGFLYS